MDKDTRHALGSGSEDEGAAKFPFSGRTNELSRPHPFEHDPKRPPKADYAGTPNPAINKTRPIARMHPPLGSGNIKAGVSFKTPMGEPYDD